MTEEEKMNTITDLAVSRRMTAQAQSGLPGKVEKREYYVLDIAWNSQEPRAYSMSFEFDSLDEVAEMIAAVRENRLPIGID